MKTAEKYLAIAFLKEKSRRLELKRQILAALDLNYSREATAIVKRGKVYECIARLTRQANNNNFKRVVRMTLDEAGIKAICAHKTYLFKGVADEGSKELRLKMRRDQIRYRASRKIRSV